MTDIDAATWLDTLGRPDPEMWTRVDTALVSLPTDDPVRLAIERERLVECDAERARTNPVLAWVAERARLDPFAFDRMMVEHARCRTFAKRAESREALEACVALFQRRVDQGEPTASPKTARALLGLALAYVADDERVRGHHIEAEKSLYRAWSLLAAPCDPFQKEIRASWHEIRADHANQCNDQTTVRCHLAEALTLLSDSEIPGRRVATLWRSARSDVAIGRYTRAARQLRAAERELPVGLAVHQRLDILHLLAFTEAARDRYPQATECLDRAKPLLDPWGHRVILAQREYLRGHLASRAARYSDAAVHWRVSIKLSLAAGRLLDAAQASQALSRLPAETELK